MKIKECPICKKEDNVFVEGACRRCAWKIYDSCLSINRMNVRSTEDIISELKKLKLRYNNAQDFSGKEEKAALKICDFKMAKWVKLERH